MSSKAASTVCLHPGRQLVHRLLEARQVGEDKLVVLPVRDAVDPAAGRVRNGRGDRDLLAHERVHQRGLTDIRPAGDGDEAGLHRSSNVSGSSSAGVIVTTFALVAEDDAVEAKLPEPLPAAAARRVRDRDHLEVADAVAAGDRRGDAVLLGTDPERIGSVLDVDSLEDRPVAREERTADLELRVRRIGASRDRIGPGEKLLVGHCATWKTTSVTSAPRMPP